VILVVTFNHHNRAQLVALKNGNELPLVRSAIPMGNMNGERIGFWDKRPK
jgi:hypothetical protein